MASENKKLHIFFFPVLAHGHMIPMVDLARLFAERGVRVTIVTTPLNLPLVSRTIGKPKTPENSDITISILIIKFPSVEAGLPEGCENVDSIPSPSLIPNFLKATTMLQEPLEQLLLQHHPDSLIADGFLPWATDSAAKFGIPRIVFHGISFFSLCVGECVRLFVIPNLPGEIKMTRMALPEFLRSDEDNEWARLWKEINESELRSLGLVVNSFYELEGVYVVLEYGLINR